MPGAPLWALLIYAALSMLVAALQHPGGARGALPALLRGLSRWALLRFADSPGTLHLPGSRQPDPLPEEPNAAALAAMAGAAERAFTATGGVLGVQAALTLRMAWTAACRAAVAEWRQLLLQRAWRGDPPEPHDPAIPPLPPRAGTIVSSVVLLVALGLAGCASGWQASLARCGLAMAPAGVESGVALALRGGEGWQDALGRLVVGYGECVVKAEVQRHADGQGPEPPSARASALTVEGHGELAARPVAAVTREVAQGRARLALAGWQDVVRPVRAEGPL